MLLKNFVKWFQRLVSQSFAGGYFPISDSSIKLNLKHTNITLKCQDWLASTKTLYNWLPPLSVNSLEEVDLQTSLYKKLLTKRTPKHKTKLCKLLLSLNSITTTDLNWKICLSFNYQNDKFLQLQIFFLLSPLQQEIYSSKTSALNKGCS